MISKEEAKDIVLEKIKILMEEGKENEKNFIDSIREQGLMKLIREVDEEPDWIEDCNVDDVVITDENTIEFDGGWIFYYQNKKFLETRDINHALEGNSPILISEQGKAFFLSNEREIEEYIELFKKNRLANLDEIRVL